MSRKNQLPSRTRRLMVESLEPRAMLTGNVTASVTDGVLTITGDDNTNGVAIRQLSATGPTTPWPGVRLEIRGTDYFGEPTTINGTSTVVVEGIKSGVNISLGEGRDRLEVVNPRPTDGSRFKPQVNLPGTVNIDFGYGGDEAMLYVINHQRMNVKMMHSGALAIRGSDIDDLRVHGGYYAESIELNNLRSRGKVWVYAGGGNDRIQIIGKWTDISGSLIVSSINAPTSFGRPEVFVSGSPVGGVPASIDDWASISGTITINTGTRPSQNFLLGDRIRVLGVKSVSRLSINTAGDNDYIQLAGVTGNALEIDGGPGDEDRLGSTDGHRPEFSTVSIVGIEQNFSGL